LKSFQFANVTLSNTLEIKDQKTIVWQVPGHLKDWRKPGKHKVDMFICLQDKI
jgi:hypothetical protein